LRERERERERERARARARYILDCSRWRRALSEDYLNLYAGTI
jgi:hypothetical protein